MNPKHNQIDAPMPPIDFGEIELGIVRGFPLIGNSNLMSAYRVTERERANVRQRENSESGSDGASTCDERRRSDGGSVHFAAGEKIVAAVAGNYDQENLYVEEIDGSQNPPNSQIRRRGDRVAYSDGLSDEDEFGEPATMMTMSPRTGRSSGHASDSELP